MAAGYVLDGALLITAEAPGSPSQAAAATVDCLLLAQREPPTVADLPGWFSSCTKVLTELGWVESAASTRSATLAPAHWFGGRTAVPWGEIRDLAVLSLPAAERSAASTGLDALVRGLSGLSAQNAARWRSRTVLGESAIVLLAVQAQSAAETSLWVAGCSLSYPEQQPSQPISGFPDHPVATHGAQITTWNVQLDISNAQLAALLPQLDPLVAPVRSAVVELTV